MSKSKKRIIATVVGMCILAAVVISAFYILTKRQDKSSESVAGSETEKIIAKDLKNNYPGTPREVLKIYSRITKCIYNETVSQEQLKQLAGQIRVLFDEELLSANPENEYMEDLQSEVNEYKEQKKSIVSYVVQKSSSVNKSTVEGKEYATILATYMVKEKNSYVKSYEEFILRQDDKGRWKILGFRLLKPEEVDDDEL